MVGRARAALASCLLLSRATKRQQHQAAHAYLLMRPTTNNHQRRLMLMMMTHEGISSPHISSARRFVNAPSAGRRRHSFPGQRYAHRAAIAHDMHEERFRRRRRGVGLRAAATVASEGGASEFGDPPTTMDGRGGGGDCRTRGEGEGRATDPLPKVIETDGVPIYLYATDIEPEALEQLRILAESPVPTDHVAAMPDAHLGKGVTVGTVFASDEYVCPNAVGVDIGCGMAAVPVDGLYRWHLKPDDLVRMQGMIKKRIPTGFSQHRTSLEGTRDVIDEITEEVRPTRFLTEQLTLPRVTDQLGTLGGGNHFLEVVYEEVSGQVWIMLHSGSRNIGNRVAVHYDRVAKDLLERQGVDTSALRGINYMPIESDEGRNYLRDMEWCQRYAYHNRAAMKRIMLDVVEQVTGRHADFSRSVNIHHNYCACEECGDGRKLWVTRKGATSAKEGEMGIIPGSMGTGSYVTRGRGDARSWNSSSHGAGRRMSRTRAHSIISQEAFEESMEGIVCDTHPSVKDEAPQAYKDLTEVMENQKSLTDIVYRLHPIVNVKGFESKVPRRYRKDVKKASATTTTTPMTRNEKKKIKQKRGRKRGKR